MLTGEYPEKGVGFVAFPLGLDDAGLQVFRQRLDRGRSSGTIGKRLTDDILLRDTLHAQHVISGQRL
jgi:hypothetical protein